MKLLLVVSENNYAENQSLVSTFNHTISPALSIHPCKYLAHMAKDSNYTIENFGISSHMEQDNELREINKETEDLSVRAIAWFS